MVENPSSPPEKGKNPDYSSGDGLGGNEKTLAALFSKGLFNSSEKKSSSGIGLDVPRGEEVPEDFLYLNTSTRDSDDIPKRLEELRTIARKNAIENIGIYSGQLTEFVNEYGEDKKFPIGFHPQKFADGRGGLFSASREIRMWAKSLIARMTPGWSPVRKMVRKQVKNLLKVNGEDMESALATSNRSERALKFVLENSWENTYKSMEKNKEHADATLTSATLMLNH